MPLHPAYRARSFTVRAKRPPTWLLAQVPAGAVQRYRTHTLARRCRWAVAAAAWHNITPLTVAEETFGRPAGPLHVMGVENGHRAAVHWLAESEAQRPNLTPNLPHQVLWFLRRRGASTAWPAGSYRRHGRP
jgi:hypothetical protein